MKTHHLLPNQRITQFFIAAYLGILMTYLWQLFGMFTDPALKVFDFGKSIAYQTQEVIFYGLFSVVLVVVFGLAIDVKEQLAKRKATLSTVGFLFCIFFCTLLVMDYNLKGLFQMGYIGDDYGYVIEIFKVFLLTPIILFTAIYFFIGSLRWKNLFHIYALQFIAIQFSFFEYGWVSVLDSRTFPRVVEDGHFLFWTVLAWWCLGVIFSKRIKVTTVE